MTAPDPRMRWWGWGVDRDATSLPEKARDMLRQAFSVEDEPSPPVPLEEVELPDAGLPGEVRDGLAAIVGGDAVREDRLARVSHALGRSYPDLVRIRSGDASSAPDAVVYPASHDEVMAVLELCSERRVAVTPFGGGTSVVGGVEPRREGLAGAISLDLARMDGIVEADPVSLTATFEPGPTGPRVEELLAAEGLTLGHFPQSWEYATLGGFVATRSAGRASTGYGRIDELVLGVRLATPTGEIALPPLPATAAGPGLRGLVVGSEGAFGVITEATLAVKRVPATKLNEGWAFDSWQAGCEAFRAMEQAGDAADVCRLSDETETALNAAASGHEAPGPCLAVVGWEGDGDDVARRAERTRAHLEHGGARPLGEEAGRAGGSQLLRGPVPARRAARDGRARGDARDGDHLEPAPGVVRGRGRRPPVSAVGARHRPAGDVPRLAPLPVRGVAVLLLLRQAGARRRTRAVARGEGRRLRRDRRPWRHDHAPSRDRTRPRALDGSGGRRGGRRGDPGGQAAARPRPGS